MKNRITIITLALLSVVGCRDETPTQPHSTLAYYVVPNSSVFPEYISTTGIPYIRARGATNMIGTITDMSETGWAVGSRINNQRLVARMLNIRTGEFVIIGDSFSAASQAKAINGRGEVVGGEPVLTLGGSSAFHWYKGVRTELGSGAAMDINDKGVVVGYSWTGTYAAWVRERGPAELRDLGEGRAYGINNHGDIVGTAPVPGIVRWRPVLWKDGAVTVLNPTGGEANDINERGQIVGQAFHPFPVNHREAFMWEKGVLTWLGTLPEGGLSAATSINDRGEIVGVDTLENSIHAVLWRDGQIIDLGLSGESGENISEAFGITNSGQVVGRVGEGSGRNGVVWLPPPR
jgi:probable HAF family extracellular repeat protein